MATKAINFKMEEADIADMKSVAAVYHLPISKMIKDAIKEYVTKLKNDPYYRLTANVVDADDEENEEILEAISKLSDDDLSISTVKKIAI